MPAVCFATRDFTRAHSFFTPLAKSRGPYSKSTTKLKVKTMNRTNQKNPRRSAMQQGSRFKPCDQWHYGHASLFARADATHFPEISREAQQSMVNAVVEFFQQRSTISARMRRLAAASIPLTARGRYRSGQTGQTVNLLALRLRWFESSPAQIFTCAPNRFPCSYRVLFREHRASR
jgi:hypothetical protein